MKKHYLNHARSVLSSGTAVVQSLPSPVAKEPYPWWSEKRARHLPPNNERQPVNQVVPVYNSSFIVTFFPPWEGQLVSQLPNIVHRAKDEPWLEIIHLIKWVHGVWTKGIHKNDRSALATSPPGKMPAGKATASETSNGWMVWMLHNVVV